MNFTFGIITDGTNDDNICKIIDSIELQNIENKEIIIVGNSKIIVDKNIEFDETIKSKWITRKKNIITENATYDNIVYLHDYIEFCVGWYEGFLVFGDDFSVCVNVILNSDGSRFRDWCIHNPSQLGNRYAGIIPYNETPSSIDMYISGSYWVAKKHIMQEIKLDESLCWGQSEDIVWSNQISKKYDFKINTNSAVRLLKYKELVIKDYSKGDYF